MPSLPALDRVIQLVAVRKGPPATPRSPPAPPPHLVGHVTPCAPSFAFGRTAGRGLPALPAPLIHQRTMLVLPSARLHGGRAQAPWARTPAIRCRENRPSPGRARALRARPWWSNQMRWLQSAAGRGLPALPVRLCPPSTKPDHSPHLPHHRRIIQICTCG